MIFTILRADSTGRVTSLQEKKRAYRWFVLAVCLFASVSAVFSYYKLAPVNLSIMKEFSVPASVAGVLIASVAVSVILLSLPAGALVAKYGPKRIGILASALTVIGTLIGVYAPNFVILLFGRLIEGGGMALIFTAAPVFILQWFPQRQTGLALGAWKVFFPIGTLLALNLGASIGSTYGWRAVWWTGLIFSSVVCVMVVLTKEAEKSSYEKVSKRNFSIRSNSAFTDLNIWMVALTWIWSGIPLVALLTWGATYLGVVKGLSIGHASFVISLCSVGGVLGSIAGGVISDKIRSRKKVYVFAFVSCLFLYLLLSPATELLLPFLLFALGFALNSGTSPITACISDLCNEKQIGLGMGIVNIANGVILFVGPVTFGLLYSILGSWSSTLYLLAVFYVPAIIFGLLAKDVK